jgi:hypothetical protein
MVDTNLLSYSSCIVDIGYRATTGIAFATPQTHGDTHNMMAVLFQEGGRN